MRCVEGSAAVLWSGRQEERSDGSRGPAECVADSRKIDLVQIDLGDDNPDHLIDPEDLVRIAFARQ
jgi:hypothetical protein